MLSELDRKLERYERIYGCQGNETTPGSRLEGLIHRAFEKTGRQVVVLIDEYDYPLLDVNNSQLSILRDVMQNFYAPLKPCDEFLRFVFLTGITKFSQLSIFSKLNNISNISMDEAYSGICGITDEELHTQMSYDVELLAKYSEVTTDEMYSILKQNYDGYHFSPKSPDIYNPYSLLSAMFHRNIRAYWFSNGTPTSLIKSIKEFNLNPTDIKDIQLKASGFDTPTDTARTAYPLLYQSGYLTITSYDKELDVYTLNIPNKEVNVGLMENLLPMYVNDADHVAVMSEYISRDISLGDIDGALSRIQKYFLTIPYCNNAKSEGHYQRLFYTILSLSIKIPKNLIIEDHTAKGRIDLTIITSSAIYIIEFKVSGTAKAALEQINEKNYAARYTLHNLPIVKVGIAFDTTSATIEEWVTER